MAENNVELAAGPVHAKATGLYSVAILLTGAVITAMLYGVTVLTAEIKAGNRQTSELLGELRTEQHSLFMATMLNDQQKQIVQTEIATSVKAKIKDKLLSKAKAEVEKDDQE